LNNDSLSSPDLYPLTFEPDTERTRLVGFDEARYREASFLDERILPVAGAEQWVDWPSLHAATAGLIGECDFIFHTGHVGSTLLSRLLGQSATVFSLREPAILRTLARAQLRGDAPERLEDWTATVLKLWARVYRPEQKTLLKATSFTAEMAPLLMRLNPSASAILMLVAPQVYLAGILAGDNSRQESKANALMRLARLHRRIGAQPWRLEAMSEGELAAMSWLSEVAALAAVAKAFPGRVLWLDFEGFLARPAAGLTACLSRLHGQVSETEVAAMARSPDLTRYSKAPEHAYDADLRRRVLAQARAEHGLEINKGLDWLDAAMNAHPALAEAVHQAAAGMRGAG